MPTYRVTLLQDEGSIWVDPDTGYDMHTYDTKTITVHGETVDECKEVATFMVETTTGKTGWTPILALPALEEPEGYVAPF